MARRRTATGVDLAVVTGRFHRTETEWRRLGLPASMRDEHEAAQAWQTHALPEQRLRYLDPRDHQAVITDRPLPYEPPPTDEQVLAHAAARREAADNWWRVARWYALVAKGALTADETTTLARTRR